MRTPPKLTSYSILVNLDDTAFLKLDASVIYVKVTAPNINKKFTWTVTIYGQANRKLLKATHESTL